MKEAEYLKPQLVSRQKRMVAELGSLVSASREANVSAFAGEADAELCLRLGAIRIYRLLGQPSVFVGTFLKTNLIFLTLLVFYCTYHTCSSPERLAQIWLGPILLGACLPAVLTLTGLLVTLTLGLWLVEKPKRLKITPSQMVLRMQLSDELFAEVAIPWSTVDTVELKRLRRFTPEKDLYVVIKTALGTSYSLRYDDLLVDNSEAAFLNAVTTWAPQAQSSLTSFSSLSSSSLSSHQSHSGASQLENSSVTQAPQFTELWLHQFSTANIRQNDALLVNGNTLKEGQYVILGVLGGGGQGNAYLASNKPLEGITAEKIDTAGGDRSDLVVLKEYIMPVYQGSSVLARLTDKLHHEAKILGRLAHPHVVKLFDCFVEDYRGYLALEFVEGRSLKELVQNEGRQSEEFVCRVATQLCSVLIYLHDFYPAIVHRDLTPDNIMLDAVGDVKVVDFNVARQLENASGATVVGKHAYIPPEQFRGRPGPQSDIYALGATLYFLLSGQDPEPLTVSHPLASAPTVNVSSVLDQIVARATAQELCDRYASARDLLRDLEAASSAALKSS